MMTTSIPKSRRYREGGQGDDKKSQARPRRRRRREKPARRDQENVGPVERGVEKNAVVMD
jgi:hypothetical protein